MTLVLGDKLGRCRSPGSIGPGAMGEASLALDTKIVRDVAIPLLPEPRADDVESSKRVDDWTLGRECDPRTDAGG